jgi:hypothetical protein
MKRVIVVVSLFLIGFSTHAQLMLDGQFRTRGELRNGYRLLASDQTYASPLVLQRSRLSLNYLDNDFLFLFSAQDARVWGQNWTAMHNNSIHIHEAWAAYKFNPNLMLKLGRQELKYDDQRVMAAKSFSITGVTYDAALLAFNNSETGVTTHLGAMINNFANDNFLTHFNHPNSFKYMSFVWGEKKMTKSLKFNALNFFDITQNPAQPEDMYGRNTVGLNVIYINHSGLFGGRVGGYYQFGETWLNAFGINNNFKINAHSYNAIVWVKPVDNIKVSVNVDTYSGHDWSSNNETFMGYNRLLAAGHAHLGFIDYFTSPTLQEVRGAGINDYFLRADLNANQRLTLQVTAHYFMLNKPYVPANNIDGFAKVDKALGAEIDLVAKYRVNNSFLLEATFMTISPTQTLKDFKLNAGEAEFSYFSYISLLFTPKFFEWEMQN